MHSLEVIEARNVVAVLREFQDAIAEDSAAGYAQAQRIAKANPDLFTHDGRVKAGVTQ